ncbi:MAG: LamG domain-containing protein [Parafilimonas sp.]|nr:LamG domain-containing protein [Parafilimonas sp.]
MSIGQWYKLVYTYDGAWVKLYINDAFADKWKHSGIYTNNEYDLIIGKSASGDQQKFFYGSIAEIRLYNIALIPQQVKQIDKQLGK